MSNKLIEVAPSILSADFANIEKEINSIEKSSCRWIHLDVMDGSFVPPITFGSQMVKAIRNITSLKLDVHLMVNNPESKIDSFVQAGADYITFHVESCIHAHRLVQKIKSKGIKCGVSIVPSTPVSVISELLCFVDLVLVMTVNPGYGGQKLIPECIEKIKTLSVLREQKKYKYIISADGGINRDTAFNLYKAGLDIAVCGSSFFKAKNKKEEVAIIRGCKLNE